MNETKAETIVLYNPSSGQGRSLKQKEKIEKLLATGSFHYHLVVTESEEHLKKLAKEAVEKYKTILGVGGDTTFNIIAAEILKYKNRKKNDLPIPVLGMIGTGSANDIVRALGIEKTEDACRAIIKGNTRHMDVGSLKIAGYNETLYFLGTVSLGLGTTVNRYVETFLQKHKILARLKPFHQLIAGLCGVHNSFSRKKVPQNINIEGIAENGDTYVETLAYSLLVFLNIPYYANGLQLIPGNSIPAPTLFDGRLDCCAIHSRSFFSTLGIGLRVGRGRHADRKEVKLLRSGTFKVSSKKEMDIQVDGEIMENISQFEISVIPGALEVLV